VLVQRDASVVHVELAAELAERGVILCSLEDAAREHSELFERYYLRRLRIDRHKLEAASAAFWTGGAFLYVPPGLQVADPFQIVYEISQGGSAQYAHTLAIGGRAATFACASTASPATPTATRCTPASSSSTSRTGRAAASRRSSTGARGRPRRLDLESSRSGATPGATGFRRCSAAP
jgi:Fe-S cluster assembly scaffold protein SufB